MHTYRAIPEAHPNGLEYGFYVEPVTLDTRDWALMAGDCLFNLRAALDHIVYELFVRKYQGRVPTRIAETSGFPILSHAPGTARGRSRDSSKWHDIGGLAFKQRRAIQTLQPYNRRQDKLRRHRSNLAVLQALNNIDKHRHLHVLQAATIMASVESFWGVPFEEGPYGFRQDTFLMRPLVGKTEVFRWTFDTLPPDIASKVNMNYNITAAICLYEGETVDILVPRLEDLVRTVRWILERFRVFLP
jgi:hypothetical protein